jgi:hypothetical protein
MKIHKVNSEVVPRHSMCGLGLWLNIKPEWCKSWKKVDCKNCLKQKPKKSTKGRA